MFIIETKFPYESLFYGPFETFGQADEVIHAALAKRSNPNNGPELWVRSIGSPNLIA